MLFGNSWYTNGINENYGKINMSIEILQEKHGYILTKDGHSFKLPRVSKVLDYCEDFTSTHHFKNWQTRMGGASKAKEYTNQCANLGTKIHSCVEALNQGNLEKYEQKKKELETCEIYDFSKKSVSVDSKKAIKQLKNQEKLFTLQGVTPRVLSSSEKKVWICDDDVQVAGELDEIINITEDVRHNPLHNKYVSGSVVVDLKNKVKQPNVTYLLRYMLQLGAYSLGWNNLHPEEPILQSMITSATSSSVNYWFCDEVRVKYYQTWFKKCVRSYLTNSKFDWGLFKSNSGVIPSPEGYDRVARNNMLPIKLEIRLF
jgi:hypothetical protein